MVSLTIHQKGVTFTIYKQGISFQYEDKQHASCEQKGQVQIRYGVSAGSLSWTTSAYSDYWGKVASELHYPFTKRVLSLCGENNLTSHFSVYLSYELGKINQDISTDTDWLLSISEEPWMKTKQPFYGQTQLSAIKIGYRISESGDKLRSQLSIFSGYHIYKLFVKMVDPVTYEIVEYEPANETIRVGLDSTYEIMYKGVKFELGGRFYFSPQFYLRGNLSYSPLLIIEANGYWNLRDMSITQSGTGDGIEEEISLNYSPTSSWQIGLTYRHMVFDLKKGNFINKLPDGTTGYGNWNSAQLMDKTIFISAIYKF